MKTKLNSQDKTQLFRALQEDSRNLHTLIWWCLSMTDGIHYRKAGDESSVIIFHDNTWVGRISIPEEEQLIPSILSYAFSKGYFDEVALVNDMLSRIGKKNLSYRPQDKSCN